MIETIWDWVTDTWMHLFGGHIEEMIIATREDQYAKALDFRQGLGDSFGDVTISVKICQEVTMDDDVFDMNDYDVVLLLKCSGGLLWGQPHLKLMMANKTGD